MTPSPDERLSIGTVLDGRYRIDAVLGTGGMGRVYRGEHTGIGRAVAIKVLHADLNRNREAAQRFQREAIASGRLDHPNIVGVSDFGVLDDGACFLVMEALEGESLGARLEREKQLPWRDALAILRGVLAGLHHAHERGVVHRDIKPDNIFLARKNDELVVKILDFGIAKLYAGTADDPASTRAGLTVGTPAYLSPEQAVGGEIKPASDIYSTSIVLFEMLVGRAPFEDADPLAMLGAHVGRPPPTLHDLAPDLVLPPGIEEMVQHGLVKTSADRIPSATDYIELIDSILAGNTATGSAPVTVPLDDSSRVSGTLGELAAAAAPSVLLTPVPDAPRATRMVSLAEAPDVPRKYWVIGILVLLAGLVLAVVLLASRRSKNADDRPIDKPIDKPVDKPLTKPADKPKPKAQTAPQQPPPEVAKPETVKPPEPPQDPMTTAPYAVALQMLTKAPACATRRAALARLVELDDPKAIPVIKKAKYRMYGGVLGIGDKNANECLAYDVDPAVKQLSRNLPPPKKPLPRKR